MNKNIIKLIKNSIIGKLMQFNIKGNNITFNNYEGDEEYNEMKYSHKLNPYYVVAPKKTRKGNYALVSKANKEDSETIYPRRYKCNVSVIDSRYKDIKDAKLLFELIQHADSPVEVKVNDFKQYIGKEEDPYPDPDMTLIDKDVKTYILPQKKYQEELPQFDANINIEFENSNYKIDNINLKPIKKLSNNSYLLSNIHQENIPIIFEIYVEYIKEEFNINFNFKVRKENSCKALIEYYKFLKNAYTKKYIVKESKTQQLLLRGNCRYDIEKTIAERIEELLFLLEKTKEVEDYLNINFNFPEVYTEEDVSNIMRLNYIIRASQEVVKFKEVEFIFDKDKKNKKIIKGVNSNRDITINNKLKNVSFKIFDQTINIKKIYESYIGMKIEDIEMVKKLFEKYDKSEEKMMKIKMIPFNENIEYKTKIKK